MAAHPPSNQLHRCVKQLELRMTFRRNSKVCNLGTLLCSLCFHTANGCPHARRSSEFTLYTEIIARTQLSLAPKGNLFRHHQALSLLYKNKMPCQAFSSSLTS
ncbi:hypothetical protein AVEN_111689-1 [Araneus ventricosus]|uniref:Uncharacterized protein n=1 Tax=Araneus ventricosus TaxID=182803 RepID=A0A4Y1ZV43_ARAVE|nr:hypothetical protein AVEN_238563-1 [Araneus ventricosus]GBL69592.1 hypothetical protein AVEN_70310-1 [Araneus ventricosus]GBL69631.1 hypothetical protein AVEN_111689-1 [Araneus ventricosus]